MAPLFYYLFFYKTISCLLLLYGFVKTKSIHALSSTFHMYDLVLNHNSKPNDFLLE